MEYDDYSCIHQTVQVNNHSLVRGLDISCKGMEPDSNLVRILQRKGGPRVYSKNACLRIPELDCLFIRYSCHTSLRVTLGRIGTLSGAHWL